MEYEWYCGKRQEFYPGTVDAKSFHLGPKLILFVVQNKPVEHHALWFVRIFIFTLSV